MEHRELNDMIEILELAIARQETEEKFFRRSAEASTNEVAKSLFNEIADDLEAYRKGLDARRQKLMDAMTDLKKATDPVCGMKINIADAKHVATSKEKKYYFCSEACKTAFELSPGKYVGREH